ncbi:hypothetical protein IX39_04745 [Chryseobacterium formosense]|uniref:DUF6705 domain-containing protein n=1 Tax=Chryseobacterium formosense TaxID=236814 RepID=A0A085Z696_9FLAO|nr:DUF6705 family protein [Chryseobacterium formosense]KFE99959.1 hypothetical protein IX39_04745 [Chryseobacterium formosense]SFT60568.1 hypothetical protein SAMN05421857_2033 [Chryseobacterium formosense]
MQKNIFILFIFFYSYIAGQKFPIKRTFDYSKWYIIKGKDLKRGDYFKDKKGKYNPYIGTWYYKENDLVFILKLQKVQFLFASKDNKSYYWWYMDRMVSTFKIIKDNIVLIDNLNAPAINTSYQKDKKEKDQYGSFMMGVDENSLGGQLRDTNLKYFYAYIYYNNIDDKIKIKLNKISSCKYSAMQNEPLCLIPNEIELSRYKSDN